MSKARHDEPHDGIVSKYYLDDLCIMHTKEHGWTNEKLEPLTQLQVDQFITMWWQERNKGFS